MIWPSNIWRVMIISKNNELIAKSMKELAPLIRHREVSPVELTSAVLEQVATYNDALNAFITISSEKAAETAKEAEKEIMQGNYRGPLHGMPMGIKDNIYFKNQITTMGSKIHQHFVPDFDATVVKRLRDAGVIFTGKLNMHEYALGGTTDNPFFGTCHNPWDYESIPGGSSGGAGAAIAADMSVASLGTDTSGSIRMPASACGIVGFKPTYGKVSKYGCFPEAWSLDHVGPMTKTVYDAAAMLEVISGLDENDPTSIDTQDVSYTRQLSTNIHGVILGVNEDFFFKDIDSKVEQLIRDGISRLEDMGAKIVPVDIPILQDAEFALTVTDTSETSAVHHHHLKSRPQDFGEDVRLLLEMGEIPSAVDYIQAQQLRRRIKFDFQEVFQKVDVLIAPTMPAIPKKINAEFAKADGKKIEDMSRLVGPANLAGLPSLTLPCGLSEGLPVGMEIMGPAFEEEKVFNVGYAFESTAPLDGKRPHLDALER